MRLYHVYYNKITSEVKVVFDGLQAPSDEFVKAGSIEHDNANQSAQQLRTKAITLMAQKYPTHDVGAHTKINFVDEEPFGSEKTEASERRLHPEKFEDEEGQSRALDESQIDPNVGNGGSVGEPVTDLTEDKSVAGEGGEGQTKETYIGTEGEQVGGISTAPAGDDPKSEPEAKEPLAEDVKADKVSVSAPETDLKVGQTFNIEAKVEPEDAKEQDLIHESSDAAVAKVSKAGKVTALAVGEATIRSGLKSNMDVFADTKVVVTE